MFVRKLNPGSMTNKRGQRLSSHPVTLFGSPSPLGRTLFHAHAAKLDHSAKSGVDHLPAKCDHALVLRDCIAHAERQRGLLRCLFEAGFEGSSSTEGGAA
jgi:hypothetical protein